MQENSVKVIVGLGNPGQAYETTRHNMGHLIVRSFASGFSAKFNTKSSLKAEVSKILLEDGTKVYLLLPDTYMNLSGLSVRACIKKLGVDLENILVVSDDIYLSFGAMRLRMRGSHGGHNGLKSIESCLGTRDYMRLRVGVSAPVRIDLSEYVLQNFSKDQFQELEGIMKNAHVVLDYWLKDEQDLANQFANKTISVDQGEDHEENA